MRRCRGCNGILRATILELAEEQVSSEEMVEITDESENMGLCKKCFRFLEGGE